MITRAAVVAEARTWLHTPWQHGTALKGVATDCIGLIGGVGKALGLPGGEAWENDPQFKGYGRTPDPVMLLAACDKYFDHVDVAGAGDIVVMRARGISQPTHFAIVSSVDPIYIIHSRLLHEVSENRLDKGLAALVLRAYRYRGVA